MVKTTLVITQYIIIFLYYDIINKLYIVYYKKVNPYSTTSTQNYNYITFYVIDKNQSMHAK